jgi:hypothetical protein
MTVGLAISLLAVPILWAFAEWSLGPLLCLATAIVQDPLRKLTPAHPVLFVGFVGVVFGAMCLGALIRGVPLNLKSSFGRYRQLALPFSLFLLLVVVEALNSYIRFENPMITLIGLLTYLLPLLSIVCSYQWVVRQGQFRINQFMNWYIVCIGLALITVYLEYSGYRWPVLGSVGPKLIIYDNISGIILPSFSGIFRAPEIAAWHAMTAGCFVLLSITRRRITVTRLLTTVIVAALLIALGLLTGRRKIAIEFAVFVSTYVVLWAIFERGVGKLVNVAVVGAALAGYAWLAGALQDGVPRLNDRDASNYGHYLQHTENAFGEVPSRFVELGIAPVMWAYDSFGLFGAGLGVGSQGTQYFGGGGRIVGAAEGGLGKIVLELGVPGLFVMGWIAIVLYRYLWQIMRTASRHSPTISRLSFGLVSFLVANAAGFSVATQAYGDLFVLLILSWTLGFLFAIPTLVQREAHARQLRIFEERSPVLRVRAV